MKLAHPALVDLLQQAYSAEKAAAFAYQGHAGSVNEIADEQAIKQIKDDEWNHRKEVLELMELHDVPVSKFYEFKYHVIGKIISASCYVIGWFMPYFFAGKLESGNVCEYFSMKQYFNSLSIIDHDLILYELGMKEKEHEIYFLNRIKYNKLLPVLFFTHLAFSGRNSSF